MPPSGLAEDWCEVNGKRVPRNVYEAALLMNESANLIRSNCLDRAMGKLRRASLLAPEMPEIRSNLAVLLARQGKVSEARVHLVKAAAAKNPPGSVFLNLATLYQTTGDIDKAIETYQIYIKLTGDKTTKAAVDLLRTERARRAAASKKKVEDDYLAESNFYSRIRWSDSRMPIKVFVDPVKQPVEGYQESYGNSLRKSFYEWSAASGNRVRFAFTPDEHLADIRCYWTNDPRYLGDGVEAGETRMKSLGHAMVSADIYLRAREESGDFPYNDTAVKGTCLHEIGHALGISGHSLNVADIMFFSTPFAEGERQISNRDKNTLVRLYSQPLDVNSTVLDFLVNPETYKKWGVLALGLVAAIAPIVVICIGAINKNKKRKKTKNKKQR